MLQDGPAEFTLVDPDDEDKTSVVRLETRYLPVPIKLEPRESVNSTLPTKLTILQALTRMSPQTKASCGLICLTATAYMRRTVEVCNSPMSLAWMLTRFQANPIPSSSSPSTGRRCSSLRRRRKRSLQNGTRTLSCKWYVSQSLLHGNTSLTHCVQPSRAGADFQLEVFDWNQIEQAKSLGSAKIDLESVEPFTAVERTLPLSHHKHGDKGEVRIRLLFTPEIIVKSRKNTSTFSTAGRAMTQIGHIPVGAGKGVLHGVTGVFKRHGDGSGSDSDSDGDRRELPAGVVSKQVDYAAEGTSPPNTFPSVNEGGAHSRDPGTLRVVVKDAKDLSMSDIKPYVLVRVGDKEHKTKHSHKTAAPEW